jgi:predicted RNA-binding Zn ribbon-like protein
MLISTVRDDLCLDYANSRSWRGSEVPTERLSNFADLLGWIAGPAGTDPGPLRPIEIWSRKHPDEAADLFTEAIVARELVYRIFSAIAVGEPIKDRDFAALKTAIATAPARKELVQVDGHYAWRIEDLRPSVPHLLAPILWSAGDLLLNLERRRLRRCENEKCLWLFLDESKSGTRRWCDMASCGNRAKARRHYSKVKGG